VRSALLLFTLLVAVSLTAQQLEVRPAPAWFEELPVDLAAEVPRGTARWGLYDLLSDHQVRALADTSWEQTFRVVRKVTSTSGVQNASELSLDFDPSYETLVLHEVTIIRGVRRIDALEPEEIRVIEKESESDDRIYDGQRTALLFVKDVRPGDVLEYTWSLRGANPILGGRYTDEYDLSTAVPTKRLRHRLLWPIAQPLHWRGENPVITVVGNQQVLVWERSNVPAIEIEDTLPSWFEPWSSVQVTEFASWREVAAWALALFQLDERSQHEVQTLAAELTSANATPDARVTAAIRFVQDDIRYLGIEMGRNSHEPHQPWETLEQRWGDCKDKTLLLVALLREMGIEAYPALVNTRLQRRLEEKLPSPFLFDHVIAQVIDNGKTYWVDGTISHQGGSLHTLETPSDERALVVRAGTNALAPIDANARGAIVVAQTYTTKNYKDPVELEVRTTYTGSDADSMRAGLAALTVEDFASERINALAIDQPKIESVGTPSITDDRLRNTIVIVERYRVSELWRDGNWSWYPRVLESYLSRPDTMIREMPLAFPFPLDVQQTVTFNMPEDVDVEASTSVTESKAFRYESVVDANGKTITIRQTLRALRDSVDAKDVPDHLTKLSELWNSIGFRLDPEGAQPGAEASTSTGSQWAVGIGMVAVFVIACVWLSRRRPATTMTARPLFAPGEAPASALAVATHDDIASHLAEIRCRCGAAHPADHEVQRAMYDERELTIVTRQCGSCGTEQSLYFTAA
jgi:transglutaminase-like putative cysteine protease